MMSHPQIRTVTVNRYSRRRFSACHRHPTEPVTGFCALCLRDRLAGLDSSSGQVEAEKVVARSRRTRGHGVVAFSSVPELRRSKSFAAGKCEVLKDFSADPRRKSCDVRVRSTLSDLFVGDDAKKALDGSERFESINLGFSKVAELVVETKEDEDEIRVSDDAVVQNEVDEISVFDDVITRNEIDDDDGEIEEGDLKTMKEIIDTELDNKRRNFWDAASVFSQKWRKWRDKQKEKKQSRCINGRTDNNRSKLGQSEAEYERFGRRSCDTEPRFSMDAHRLSVEDPRFSFDEHRASWDGYMIAKTIPRLTPMLSTVDSMMPAPVNRGMTSAMENLQIHSIREDGDVGQSISGSSTSNRGSSSSSMKSSSTKTVGSVGDDVKPASNARVSPANDVIFQGTKMVITEKELKDWHLNSIKNNATESVCNAPNLTSKTTVTNSPNGHKMIVSSRWKKVCNLWGHKHKLDDNNGDKNNVENIPENKFSTVNLVRNTNSRNRRDEFMLDRNRNTRYSASDIDSGLLRLYLTPFRNPRRIKSGRSRAPSMGLQQN
ncbi:hypothetical protein R6Q59_028335 [Mikania micrantha]|uniref:DUF740 domain-containing protein n=1 Tax=Mikania micrantha TaxID=192012 RepID=A0A5N6M752_9ASTR|nr:hypothetical protein E3N88_31978 [Mikania micrantha]